MSIQETKLVIVGSGSSGYTAAVYAARADVSPVILAGSVRASKVMAERVLEHPAAGAGCAAAQDAQHFLAALDAPVMATEGVLA